MIHFVNYGSKSFIQRQSDLKVFLVSMPKYILSLIGKYYTYAFDRNGFVRPKQMKSQYINGVLGQCVAQLRLLIVMVVK